MADRCVICKEKTPTNHLVLNGGDLWIEFCKSCGEKETLTNQNNETFTIQEIFDKSDKPR
jgi:hypothetical protein